MPISNLFPRGSEWRKWDLHVHAPLGKLYDGYRTSGGSEPIDKFCDVIEASDVQVFGITDYFSIGSFRAFIQRFRDKYPDSRKNFFFNLELRLNETVNKELEEVNVHFVFNPSSLDRIDKFLSLLSVVKTGRDAATIMCSELTSDDDFESATVNRTSIVEAFEKTFGKKAERQDHFLIITAANNDGLRPQRGKKRKEGICDEIDKFSDAFFGGSQNVHYYLDTDRYEDDQEAAKKPVVAGSDAHSFEDLENFLGKRFVKETEKDGKKIETIEKDITWIKADLTYEGLKQILYEPESGERAYIGSVRPDQKDDYKVIRKIKFANSVDFPDEIELNPNLCSIIGSRSSGKSALLAYIAHSIDPDGVEEMTEGPGEGEDYHWKVINLDYGIEWRNGKANEESPGSVVYVPQNYLFKKSKDPDEIKAKIQPVLFRVMPKFETDYRQAMTTIEGYNSQIAEEISNWFAASDEIKAADFQLKELGDERAIEQQKTKTEAQILALKEKNKLSEADLEKYQEITAEIAGLTNRIKEIGLELVFILAVSPDKDFFTAAKITLTPTVGLLPSKLQAAIKTILESNESSVVTDASQEVLAYKNAIIQEKDEKEAAILTINDENRELIEKYKKNAELESLIKTVNEHVEVLRKISDLGAYKKAKEDELRLSETAVAEALAAKSRLVQNLEIAIKVSDRNSLDGIEFGLESGFDEAVVEQLSHGINLKEKTDFIEKNELRIDEIRNHSARFLSDVYSGKQKINAHYDKESVATEALQLTEKVLFTAQMEGDKIGGFSESTMTPGKRALFALRLILAESEDTWPLLIDQPEDDLDSRSTYDEVVPFLKAKKKERQIIMVSHNANLVIGSDSEQLIIANRNGNDRKNEDGKQFNYLTGSLEFTKHYDEACEDTLKAQGVCEHALSILDGGRAAFENRKNRYHVK